MSDVDIQTAKSLSVDMCEHGSLTLSLHGADDEVFATATMDPQHANAVATEMLGLLLRWASGAEARAVQ